MAIRKPFNLNASIDEHRHLLKPPVGNKQVYFENDDYIVMIVGGPNGRKDYHYEDGEELFYQIEGDITLKIIHEDVTPEDIEIKEGEMFLLPPRIPHSPQRPADTIGLVIERYRRDNEEDKLMWFCENCTTKLYEEDFKVENIETDMPKIFDKYYGDKDKRACPNCGEVMQPPKKVQID